MQNSEKKKCYRLGVRLEEKLIMRDTCRSPSTNNANIYPNATFCSSATVSLSVNEEEKKDSNGLLHFYFEDLVKT